MKRVGMGLLLLVKLSWTQAQSLGGIFSQGSTELKNNAAQMLELQALDASNQNGYQDMDDGLTNIGDIHGAEYNLHQQYITSLEMVNPQIATLPEPQDIRNSVPATIATLSTAIGIWTAVGGLTNDELNGMITLDSSLSRLGRAEIGVLQTLLTSGSLTMSDAERIQALRELDSAVREQAEFVTQVCADADLLIANRKKL